MTKNFENSATKLLLSIITAPIILLSWIYFNFKVYQWFKPHTGEYFSNLLPDISFWEMFAVTTVFSILTGLTSIKFTLARVESHIKKKEGEKIYEAIATPWVTLLIIWIVYSIIF